MVLDRVTHAPSDDHGQFRRLRGAEVATGSRRHPKQGQRPWLRMEAGRPVPGT